MNSAWRSSYDNRKEYGAAKIYYETVKEDFADTNLALESENRLAAIGGLPAVPEQNIEWLANLFPDEPPAKPLIARSATGTATR